MVTKLRKEETIKNLQDKFSKASAVYTTEHSALSVAEITELRGKLRELGAEFKIAKNTLIGISSKGTDYEQISQDLTGPTALLFCYEDGVAPAGALRSFAKDLNAEKISFKAGLLDGEVLDADKVLRVASLPSKDVILSQIAGMLVQPLSSMAYIFGELGEKDNKDQQLKDLMSEGDDSSDDNQEEAKAEEAPEAKAEEESKTAAEESGTDAANASKEEENK